jgi:predicted  nucleic acid-binding Zn-ribbon protein
MLPEITTLLVVQNRDQKIMRLKRELARYPKEEQDARTRLAGDTKALQDAKAAVQANEVAIKNLQLDVDTRNNSISRLKVQQYETKKNDEYTAIGHEIERYQKEVEALEDRELALMEDGDALKARVASLADTLAKTTAGVDDDLSKLAERQGNDASALDEVQADRQRLAGNIDPDLLDMYDKLLANKGDAAIVALTAGKCSGCHMKVIQSTALAVKTERGIVQCENCGRILYFEE